MFYSTICSSHTLITVTELQICTISILLDVTAHQEDKLTYVNQQNKEKATMWFTGFYLYDHDKKVIVTGLCACCGIYVP